MDTGKLVAIISVAKCNCASVERTIQYTWDMTCINHQSSGFSDKWVYCSYLADCLPVIIIHMVSTHCLFFIITSQPDITTIHSLIPYPLDSVLSVNCYQMHINLVGSTSFFMLNADRISMLNVGSLVRSCFVSSLKSQSKYIIV